MLRRFDSIAGYGIFENFRWASDALGTPDFERINVIYGDNGSGKTSLANALDGLANEEGGYSKVSISIKDKNSQDERQSKQNDDAEFRRVFVFGDKYVDRNLHFEGNTEATAILTLGQKTIEQKKRIAELKPLIEKTQSDLAEAKTLTIKRANRLNEKYKAIASNIVLLLSRASGIYSSSRTYHQGYVRKLFEGDRSDWALLPDKVKTAAIDMVNSDNRNKVDDERSYSFSVRPELGQDIVDALAEIPVVTALDTLQQHPEATSWVEQGRSLHNKLHQCLFCGGALTDDRKRQIEQHFSREVENVQHKVDSLIDEVQNDLDVLKSLLGDKTLRNSLFDDLGEQFSRAYDEEDIQITALNTWLKNVLKALKEKRENVIASSDFEVTIPPEVDGLAIEELLKTHNERVNRHTDNVQKSARNVELHLLKEAEDEVNALIKAVKAAEENEKNIDEDLNGGQGKRGYRSELASLENSEGDPLPSAENMTSELVRILGRRELSFKLTPDGKNYEVSRYGNVARDLSTGERTAIALIHFLETIKHTNSDSGKPIVIIDDPVSSLDRNAATGISTYIWNETAVSNNVEQVFLLTHSFELFRQWDIQIGKLGARGSKNKKGYTSNMYELISKYKKESDICRRIPKILFWPPNNNEELRKKIRSTYHHEFMTAAAAQDELRKNPSMEAQLDAMLLYPNALRRMLETFLAFKDPTSVGDFTGSMRKMGQKLEDLGYEGDANGLRQQLTRFVHTGSHAESPDTSAIVNPDEIGTIITAVFTFMHAVDPEHFNGLCTVTGLNSSDLLQEPEINAT